MSLDLLSKKIELLWEDPSTHSFMTQFVGLIQSHSLKDVVLEAARYMSTRCYLEAYQGTVPHCLIGLESAWQLGAFFHSPNRYLPVAQMVWYGVGEARAQRVDIKKIIKTPPDEDQLTIENFADHVKGGDFDSAYRWLVFLLRDAKKRKKVFRALFQKALPDEVDLGHKLIYLIKTWEFCEAMGWKDVSALWHPTLHYLMNARPHREIYPTVEVFYNQNWKVFLTAMSNESGGFKRDTYRTLKDVVYNDEKISTLEHILTLIQGGESFENLCEMVKLAACELVYTASHEKWVTTTHAFHYVQGITGVLSYLEPQDQMKGLLMASLFVKKMAILSKPLATPDGDTLETLDQMNNPLYFMEYGIQRGQLSLALGSFDYLVSKKGVNPAVLETLAFLASKNQYQVLYGHDIKCAYAALKSYRDCEHDLQSVYLKALVRLLAESPKEQTIYNSLTNTQKIKAGFYSAPGTFNF